MVDGCRSKLVNVVSGVPHGSVLGPLLFLLDTSELLSIVENKLIGYAADSTLMAVVPKVYRLKEEVQGKSYLNIITHNAKLATSPGEFRRSCVGDLLRDIGGIIIFLCNNS